MSRFDFRLARVPTLNTFRKYVARAPNSAPGSDGFPYCLYRVPIMTRALYGKWRWLANGHLPPHGFNDVLLYFPPKGREEHDNTLIVRDPSQTRPLGLRCTDNKAILAIITAAFPISSRDRYTTANGAAHLDETMSRISLK